MQMKKLNLGMHNSSMSVIDENKDYDNRYEDKQYQSLRTPHDNDS